MRVAKIKSRLKRFITRYYRQILLGVGAAFGVAALGLLVSYMLPSTVAYSFATRQSCVISPVIFPRSLPVVSKSTFALRYAQTVSIAGTTLYAREVCAAPQQSPRASSSYTMTLAFSRISPVKKKITVHTSQYAHVSPVAVAKPLTLANSLEFQLSQADSTFTYVLSINGHQGVCAQHGRTVMCPLGQLSLQYGQQYHAALERTFKQDAPSEVAQLTFQTISATVITNSSVTDGATVFDKPQQFTFQTDKQLVSLGAVTLSVKNSNGSESPIATSATYSGNTITLSVAQPLPRKTNMQLVITSLRAQDASGLAVPYTISFYVSGGPRVTSTSLASYNVTAAPMTVNFDQSLDPSQGTSQLALQANGAAVATNMIIEGSRIVITPQASYPVCAHLTLSVGPNLANAYGVSGDSGYTYNSRAQCHTTFSIGTSVQGRPLTAYKIGSGSTQLLFVGTMHGTEGNAGSLLNAWLNDLEANVDSIPSGRTIVIIPYVNPDGFAANTRVNADNIDLNRNFPASDWQSIATEPNGSTGPYGGPHPLSEPESQALANYMEAQRPAITVDYHSHAGVVQGNDASDADTLALHYALTSGYSLISSGDTGTEFDYSTTGSFEDWTNQSLGLPEFLVELSSPTNNEFSWNRPAMWNLVKGSL